MLSASIFFELPGPSQVGTLVTDVPRDMSVASGYLSCGWHLEDLGVRFRV